MEAASRVIPKSGHRFSDQITHKKKEKEMERRQTRIPTVRAIPGAARIRLGMRHLPAFHHGTCGSDRTPPLSSSSRAS
jgi:hypothetical protein